MREAELTCNSCKKRVVLNEMKYSKDGAGLICSECYDKEFHGGVSLRQKHEMTNIPAPVENKKKVQFVCKHCAFRYSRALDFRGPKLCPNCGRDSVVYNLPNKAEDLLRELDEMDDI
ncbi:hypothetical protein JXB27_04535 [Candidatus Woesearchaeota archaeon]|nr:hypothetical protein [Candidatus Woesearchaeota archaeon]